MQTGEIIMIRLVGVVGVDDALTMNAADVSRVTVISPTVDWVRAEAARYLARHPGAERRAVRWLFCRREFRRMARAFYGEGGAQ